MTSSERSHSSKPSQPELAYVDVKSILERLGDVTEQLVLVGGQAVNFWADRYQGRVPELRTDAPFTSKDIDFCGTRDTVRTVAVRLGGNACLATIDDTTVNVGVVTFVDDHGAHRMIDFIDHPFGLEAADVHRTAIPVDLLDEQGGFTGVTFRVMHPVLCMKSRVYNTMRLPGYDRPHALKQLSASVQCAREFLLDLVDAGRAQSGPEA